MVLGCGCVRRGAGNSYPTGQPPVTAQGTDAGGSRASVPLLSYRLSRAPRPARPRPRQEESGGAPQATPPLSNFPGHADPFGPLGPYSIPLRRKRAPRCRDSRGVIGYHERGIGMRPSRRPTDRAALSVCSSGSASASAARCASSSPVMICSCPGALTAKRSSPSTPRPGSLPSTGASSLPAFHSHRAPAQAGALLQGTGRQRRLTPTTPSSLLSRSPRTRARERAWRGQSIPLRGILRGGDVAEVHDARPRGAWAAPCLRDERTGLRRGAQLLRSGCCL